MNFKSLRWNQNRVVGKKKSLTWHFPGGEEEDDKELQKLEVKKEEGVLGSLILNCCFPSCPSVFFKAFPQDLSR